MVLSYHFWIAFLFIQYLLVCWSPLPVFQSSDKVDSYSFCLSFRNFLGGRAFRGYHSALFADISFLPYFKCKFYRCVLFIKTFSNCKSFPVIEFLTIAVILIQYCCKLRSDTLPSIYIFIKLYKEEMLNLGGKKLLDKIFHPFQK